MCLCACVCACVCACRLTLFGFIEVLCVSVFFSCILRDLFFLKGCIYVLRRIENKKGWRGGFEKVLKCSLVRAVGKIKSSVAFTNSCYGGFICAHL